MLKSLVRHAVHAAGFEVVRRGQLREMVPLERQARTVAELEALYRECVFPDLPPRPGRERLLARLEGTNASEGLWLLEHLHRSLRVPGDVCEFGVAQGATSALLASELLEGDRRLWLFDSFEGLPKPTEKDVLIDDIFGLGSMERYQGTMSYGPEHVRGRLREVAFPEARVEIVPGFIEKSITAGRVPCQVCFAYVDFDFYEPIKVALEFLDGVVAPGGHVMVDDYGWFSSGAQTAVHEFVAARVGRYQLIKPPDWAGHFAVLARLTP